MYARHGTLLLLCGIAFSKRVLDSQPPAGNEGLLNADRDMVAEGDAGAHMVLADQEADMYPQAETSGTNEVTFSAMEVRSGENDALPGEESRAARRTRGRGRGGGIGAQHANIVENVQSEAAAIEIEVQSAEKSNQSKPGASMSKSTLSNEKGVKSGGRKRRSKRGALASNIPMSNERDVQSVNRQSQSEPGGILSKSPLSNEKEMKPGEENTKSKRGASVSNKAMSNEGEVKSGEKQRKSKPEFSLSKVSTSNDRELTSGEKFNRSKPGGSVSEIAISNGREVKPGEKQREAKHGGSATKIAKSNERGAKSGEEQKNSGPGVGNSNIAISNKGDVKSGEKVNKSKVGIGVSKIEISNVKGGKSGEKQNTSKLMVHEGFWKSKKQEQKSKLGASASKVRKLKRQKPSLLSANTSMIPCWVCNKRWFGGVRKLDQHITSVHADKPRPDPPPFEDKGRWVYRNDFKTKTAFERLTRWGYFHCDCDRQSHRFWYSAQACREFRQRCHGCQQWRLPYYFWVKEMAKVREDKFKPTEQENRRVLEKPHDQEGCEACCKFGMNCRKYFDEHFEWEK